MTDYDPTDVELDQIKAIFTFHPVQADQPQRYEHLRAAMLEVAVDVMVMCPPSRERSLAITKMQEAVMWANAAIAINEKSQVDISGLGDTEPHFIRGEH
jgi:hypothetical protein